MKRRSTVALLTLGLALPACAQRGGSHGGGSSSHSSAPMHSGGFTSGSFTPPATPYNSAHPAYGNNNNRNRWNYTWRYRNGVPSLSAVWIGPDLGGGYL